MRRSWVAILAVFALACGGPQKTQEPAPKPGGPPAAAEEAKAAITPSDVTKWAALPAAAVEAPPSLMVEATLGNPMAQARALGDWVSSIQPGMGAMLTPEFVAQGLGSIVGVQSLAGFDLEKPIYILILDPGQVADGVLVVGTVKDRAQLEQAKAGAQGTALHLRIHASFAALGGRGALEEASAYALTNLVTRTPPPNPTATVYVASIVTRYLPMIQSSMDAAVSMMKTSGGNDAAMADIARLYIDAMMSVLRQTDRAVVTLESGATDLNLLMDMVLVEGGGVRSFTTAQQPATYDRVAQVPEGAFVFGGRIDWAPAAPLFARFNRVLMESYYGTWNEELQKATDQLMQQISGEMAMSMDLGTDHFNGAGFVGLKDPKAAEKIMRNYWSLVAKGKGGKIKIKYRQNAFKHGKVRLDETVSTLPTADMPKEQREMMEKMFGKSMTTLTGVAGNDFVFVFGKDARGTAKKLLAGAGKPTPPSGGLAEALAGSRARKESAVFYVDPLLLMSMINQGPRPTARSTSGFTMGAGFVDGNVQFRLSLPAAAIAAMQQP